MAVVVTGAAGFLGSNLVDSLHSRGERVVGIDRRPMTAGPRFAPIVADLSAAPDDVVDALRAADAVVHLAGCPGVRDDGRDVAQRRQRDNVTATEVVLAATPRSTPLIVASSSSVYGGSAGGACAEDSPLRPRGGYALSKLAVELACAARRDAGGAVTVVRPFTVAGEGQREDMAIARWLAAARAGRPLVVLGSLDRRRDVTDVRDVTRALLTLLAAAPPTTVNIGTGASYSLRDHVHAIAAAVGDGVEVVVRPASGVEPAATLADTRRCAALVGFVPRTDLTELVARQAAATTRRLELAS